MEVKAEYVNFEAGLTKSPQPLCRSDRRNKISQIMYSTVISKIVNANDELFQSRIDTHYTSV